MKRKRTWNDSLVGDLVFLVGDKQDIVPAKIKEIQKDKYIFEEIIPEIPIPFTELNKNLVGFNSGKAFITKNNAIDYFKIYNQKGSFNIGDLLSLRLQNALESIDINNMDTNTSYEENLYLFECAMYIAMNKILNIGSVKSKKVIDYLEQILKEQDANEIIAIAEKRFLKKEG